MPQDTFDPRATSLLAHPTSGLRASLRRGQSARCWHRPDFQSRGERHQEQFPARFRM